MQLSVNLLATALLAVAQPGAPSASSGAHIRDAVILLIDQAQVPATQAGVLKSLALPDGTKVQEGLEVEEEAELARLDDRDAKARQRASELDHQVAEAEAGKADVSIEAADKTVAVAEAEYLESHAVNTRAPNSIPQTQLRRQKLTEERARSEAKVARSDRETAKLTVDLRNAQKDITVINLDRHTIRAPIRGEVVQVFRHVGEWVNPGDPILRMVRLDRLRVQGYLKIDDYRRESVAGQPATVDVRVGARRESFPGKISYVSPELQSDGSYVVWCELDNRKEDGHWVLLPGMDAEMTISLKASSRVARTP